MQENHIAMINFSKFDIDTVLSFMGSIPNFVKWQ